MNLRKILFLAALLVVISSALFYMYWALIFFPDDYEITREEALQTEETKGSEVISISLVDLLDSAQLGGDFSRERIGKIISRLKEKGYLVKDDPFISITRRDLCFRFGTGLPGIWVDERSSLIIPDGCKISFYARLNDLPSLDFSAIPVLANGVLSVEVTGNGQKIKKSYSMKCYRNKYTHNDVAPRLYNRGFEKAKGDTSWKDYSLDLSKMARKGVKITLSFRGDNGVLFLANPKIFKRSENRRYNIIYLVFDGVSTRHWSFYNDKSELTPYMNELADKEFIVFDNMFTLGNKTRISTAGLFASVLPFKTRHGINRNLIPEAEKEIFYRYVRDGELASLPDVFSKRGYVTEQFGNSGFTVHLTTTGVDYGFNRSYEFSYNPYDSYGISHSLFKFLRKNKEREFFLYLHYNSPHKPFFAPASYFINGVMAAPFECLWRPFFMGCINYTDDVFRNIYLALKTNNLLDNTILIVATDHGAGYDISKFDMGFQYNDYTRMTFMMRLPDELKEKNGITGSRVDTYLSSINIAPTLIDFCCRNSVSAFEGRSFLDLLNGRFKKKFFDDEIWCFGRKTASLITDNMYKYILTFTDAKKHVERDYYFFGEEREVPYEEVYNLKDDPFEMNNLVNNKKEILRKFRKIYLRNDIHHPERTVLTFIPSGGNSSIEVDVKSNSRIIDAGLYSLNLEKIKGLKRSRIGRRYRYSFKIDESPRLLVFESENDRSELSIFIKSNGKPVERNMIYATNLNLNIFSNPIVLKEYKDFIILNESGQLASNELAAKRKGLKVRISRLDLHRWIDYRRLESMGISAGMKETLKSWGYIQ